MTEEKPTPEPEETPPVEWLPPPPPELGDEYDRALRAAVASGSVARVRFAYERWLRRYNELEMEAAPVAVERIERWLNGEPIDGD